LRIGFGISKGNSHYARHFFVFLVKKFDPNKAFDESDVNVRTLVQNILHPRAANK
jgi:hypothetical protein